MGRLRNRVTAFSWRRSSGLSNPSAHRPALQAENRADDGSSDSRPCDRRFRWLDRPRRPDAVALTRSKLNRPVATPGRDRAGWRQSTAAPNLQSGAARRGSRRCTPHDCAIENKRWAVPAEARAEHDAVLGVGQRGERDAHDTAGLAGVDRADRRWRTPVGEHRSRRIATVGRAGAVAESAARRLPGGLRSPRRPRGSRLPAALRRRLHARCWERRPRRRGRGVWAPAAAAGRPARRRRRSRSGSGPRPAGPRPCQVRHRCGP